MFSAQAFLLSFVFLPVPLSCSWKGAARNEVFISPAPGCMESQLAANVVLSFSGLFGVFVFLLVVVAITLLARICLLCLRFAWVPSFGLPSFCVECFCESCSQSSSFVRRNQIVGEPMVGLQSLRTGCSPLYQTFVLFKMFFFRTSIC